MASKDRRGALLTSTSLTGIDFVEIANDAQTLLRVHFLNRVDVRGKISRVTITGGETIPEVPVRPFSDATDWSTDSDGHWILRLSVDAPGDFSTYLLSVFTTATPNVLDAFFSTKEFSFKARCESQSDCRTPDPVCPVPESNKPPIDYLAKDFLSFRQALLDFSALRYPQWQERSEADFGVMFTEALSALADDLSYTQDRVAAEAALDTATERRSQVRLARLVDYEPTPATAASVLLQFTVGAGVTSIPSGLLVSAPDPDGSSVFFETGTGLDDTTPFPASQKWNGIKPYFFDDSLRCLTAGSTGMFLEGHGLGLKPGTMLLIETAPVSTADQPLRQIVTLDRQPEQITDSLFGNAPVTRISWPQDQSLQRERDLTRTVIRGNIAPATQGKRYTETFTIGTVPGSTAPEAVVRTGPNGTAQHLYTVRNAPLAWLASGTAPAPGIAPPSTPEVLVRELRTGLPPRDWTWRRKLLDSPEFDRGFTLDPVRFARTSNGPPPHLDYDGSDGDTVRFGDGTFGLIPEAGTTFEVTYRVGAGDAGNVAAGAITRVESPPAGITNVTNPFAAAGGADPQTAESIRRLAPQAFRARQFRAVRPEDYEAAAEGLPWVQRAGTVFRWTGSWLTVFTTADPKDTERIPVSEHIQLIDLLNRYRLAGYESYAPAPRYIALDLQIAVCARPDAFRGDVRDAVLAALVPPSGFFQFDNFTFGVPLERSALEAAIQRVPGVAGVISVLYRRRGLIPRFVAMPLIVAAGSEEIILVENDPSRPERGSIQLSVSGGK